MSVRIGVGTRQSVPVELQVIPLPGASMLRWLGCIGRGLLFLVVLVLGLALVGTLFPFLLVIAVLAFLLGVG